MEFKLSHNEKEKLNNWKKQLPKIPVDASVHKYQFIYKFSPTGLGTCVIVERIYDGQEIDLTDYNNW